MKVSIITSTIGEPSLAKLLESIYAQDVDFEHIVLWDEKWAGDDPEMRDKGCVNPLDVRDDCRWERSYNIEIPGTMVQGPACGSALRSIGLMAARGDYVTFADSDVWWDKDHLKNMLALIENKNWCYCRRKVYNANNDLLGQDNFESVGNSPERLVPYEMVDNNCMMFKRRYGTSGAVLYRETQDYNDDRLMYKFLKDNAGEPNVTKEATVHQVCPKRLEQMFTQFCTNE